MYQNNRSRAGKEEVRNSAEELLSQNGQTTTLEVKNALRAYNFIILQAEVSHWMAELASELGWQFRQNGAFRIYREGLKQPKVLSSLLMISPN